MAEYAERTQEDAPDRFKVNLLLRMLPVKYEKETGIRYVTDQSITFHVVRD